MSDWKPIESLDRTQMQFVLVHEDGAIRAFLWNPYRERWEHPVRGGLPVDSMDECATPTHWMELPDPPAEK